MSKTHLSLFMMVGASLMLTAPTWADFQAGQKAYERGDYETALKEWQVLALQGDAGVQVIVGLMYGNGEGVPQDDGEAVKWFRLAAEQGDSRAQLNLGFMYSQGRGVPQDYVQAAKWVRLAAEQGDAGAQFNLGRMYFEGLGVPHDFVLALMWTNLAAAQGNEAAIEVRKVLGEKLRDDQIAEAQRLAREWKPNTAR